MKKFIVVVLFVLITSTACEVLKLDPKTKPVIDAYEVIKEDDRLSPFLPENNVLEQKIGTNSTCTDSIYGDGDGCLTWQDCVDGKCIPESGKCEKDEDCPNGLKCKGYHDCR